VAATDLQHRRTEEDRCGKRCEHMEVETRSAQGWSSPGVGPASAPTNGQGRAQP
jgi:hypothetical protein